MKVAVTLANLYEEREFGVPTQALRDAGHEVVVVGAEQGEVLKGVAGKSTVTADASVADVRAGDFDALFIPGGFSPDQLRYDKRFVAFACSFMENNQPVFAICHGPQLLIPADVLEGRTVTAWYTVQDDLRRMNGVNVIDREVVEDGNLITSRHPGDLPAFSEAVVTALKSVEAPAVG